jgi:signal-transduction protein with cAMP-binding, CBS, and nucleotidyltransferase domain
MKTAEEIIAEKAKELVWIDGQKSVYDGIRLMVENRIGVVLIKQGDQFVGIFSERDLLRNSANPDFNPKSVRIKDYMSTPLRTAPYDTPLLKLKEMFLGLFIRHIVIEKHGSIMGLLSIGDVLRASLLEQDQRMKELNTFVSWEYYEDWGWDRKKRS